MKNEPNSLALCQDKAIADHISALSKCNKCPEMIGPVVTHRPILSRVLLVGQAPGPHEGKFGKPFAWTAGKTMFRWFQSIGMDEESFRSFAYMSAVCRCFPGKTKQGGDRVPSRLEIANCATWLEKEFEILDPILVIPVGKLAIAQFMKADSLEEVIGIKHLLTIYGREREVIPLPHPSGASTWFKREPGKTLLGHALELINQHPEWQKLIAQIETT